ncbi:hypothetical protein HZH68_008342 [Vespula germanica]|uniref:Uncharacterized protein n=1 Tax=Vespula germanica TaxID=30212 RepID=A0A834N7J3_VESGE|nr:hypothetical protein HZH68_008342 [Vespula germanica]
MRIATMCVRSFPAWISQQGESTPETRATLVHCLESERKAVKQQRQPVCIYSQTGVMFGIAKSNSKVRTKLDLYQWKSTLSTFNPCVEIDALTSRRRRVGVDCPLDKI